VCFSFLWGYQLCPPHMEFHASRTHARHPFVPCSDPASVRPAWLPPGGALPGRSQTRAGLQRTQAAPCMPTGSSCVSAKEGHEVSDAKQQQTSALRRNQIGFHFEMVAALCCTWRYAALGKQMLIRKLPPLFSAPPASHQCCPLLLARSLVRSISHSPVLQQE
jgi:hypothetical protein